MKFITYFEIMIIFQEELLQRISRKLEVLRSEDEALKDEMNMNEELGRHVSSLVSTENSNSIIWLSLRAKLLFKSYWMFIDF